MVDFTKIAKEQCLPIGLISAVILGILYPAPGIFFSQLPTQYVCVTIIFFISGLKLKTSEMMQAIKDVRGWFYGLFSILVLTPLIGAYLTRFVPIKPDEFRVGLNLFFIMPTSISSGVILSRQAGGNTALALMLTVGSNLAAIFIIPASLPLLMSFDAEVHLSIVSMLLKLLGTVLVPLLIGKALRYVKAVETFMTNQGVALTLFSNFMLALIPWMKMSVSRGGSAFEKVTVFGLLEIIGWGGGMHLVFFAVNFVCSKTLHMQTSSLKSVTIVASQKTLPIALTVASFLPDVAGDKGLIALPCIISHLLQIIVDSIIVSIWLFFEARPGRYAIFDFHHHQQRDVMSPMSTSTNNGSKNDDEVEMLPRQQQQQSEPLEFDHQEETV